MIKVKLSFFIIFFISFFLKLSANEKIVFIDLDFIVNNSLAGKTAILQIEDEKNSSLFAIQKMEQDLKDEENKVMIQKNVISENEFSSKINNLKNKIKKYQELRIQKNNKLNQLSASAKNKLILSLNPILNEYSKKNSISMVLQKKSIIIGKSDLDITQQILIEFDNKVKKINLK